MKFSHMGVSVFFSSFDKIFHLACLGTHILGHVMGFGNKYKKPVGNLTFCHIQIFKIIKNKSEGHFQCGHKYVTNYKIN